MGQKTKCQVWDFSAVYDIYQFSTLFLAHFWYMHEIADYMKLRTN